VFKDLGNGEFAFTGPYKVLEFSPGVELRLTPNPYYPDAARRPDVVIKVFKDAGAMQLAFESGEIDMAFTVTPDVALILKDKGHIVKDIDAGYQYFAIVNLTHEPLGDLGVREAVNLALDRSDMLKALRGGRVANGIFAQYYSFAGTSELKYDIEKAREILDSAGWAEGAGGIRGKDGKPLKLRLVTYPSRPDLIIIMQIAASELRDLGIETTSEIVDNIDSAAQNGAYDIIFYAQHTAPTGDPSFFLNQFLRKDGGKNFNAYSSREFEDILARMSETDQGPERDKLAVQAQDVIFSDLPLLYLVDPQWHIAVSERLKDYQPYCGDYYVINDQLTIQE
jgi:peptide/nickel transport system substrate-binding protein